MATGNLQLRIDTSTLYSPSAPHRAATSQPISLFIETTVGSATVRDAYRDKHMVVSASVHNCSRAPLFFQVQSYLGRFAPLLLVKLRNMKLLASKSQASLVYNSLKQPEGSTPPHPSRCFFSKNEVSATSTIEIPQPCSRCLDPSSHVASVSPAWLRSLLARVP